MQIGDRVEFEGRTYVVQDVSSSGRSVMIVQFGPVWVGVRHIRKI